MILCINPSLYTYTETMVDKNYYLFIFLDENFNTINKCFVAYDFYRHAYKSYNKIKKPPKAIFYLYPLPFKQIYFSCNIKLDDLLIYLNFLSDEYYLYKVDITTTIKMFSIEDFQLLMEKRKIFNDFIQAQKFLYCL